MTKQKKNKNTKIMKKLYTRKVIQLDDELDQK